MFVLRFLQQTIQYISEAASEIFSVNHDDYPLIGIQLFTGESFKTTPFWSKLFYLKLVQ